MIVLKTYRNKIKKILILKRKEKLREERRGWKILIEEKLKKKKN